MTETKNTIPQINICEYFARPDTKGRVFTNPAQLLLDDQKLTMLGFFCDDIEKMSDFERFSAFLSNLSQMYGSAVYQLFEAELAEIFSYEGDPARADACDLWRSLCDAMASGAFLSAQGVGGSRLDFLPLYSVFDSYERLIDENISAIRASEGGFVKVDLSKLVFKRTDRYHAEKSYKEFIGGTESDVFASGIMYDICAEARRLDKTLFVYAGDNYESIKAMISYFDERSVLPDTVIFSSGDTLFNIADSVCGVYGRNTRVLCGLVYENGDTAESVAEVFGRIARVYPIGKLVVGGSLTSSVAFAARHRILRRAWDMAFN